MKIDILDHKGKAVGSVESSAFELEVNEDLLAQYIRVFLTNKRQGTSSTKTRAEVSGGGKKPWRQKHTGRSRQGSIRSPIWVHGGVAHGPKPKDWGLKMTGRAKQAVLQMAISDKFKEKKLAIVDNFDIKDHKSKTAINLIAAFGVEGKVLLVWSKLDANLIKGVSNVQGVTLTDVQLLNPYQVMNSDHILMDKGALNYLQGKFK